MNERQRTDTAVDLRGYYKDPGTPDRGPVDWEARKAFLAEQAAELQEGAKP